MSLVTSHSSTCLSFGISLGRKKGQHLRIVVSIKMWMGLSSPFSPTLSITVIVHSVEHIKENSWLSTFFFLLCEREMHTVVWMVRNWRKSPKEEIKEFSPGHQTAAFLKGAGTTPWKCLELFNCCCSYCFLLHTSLNSESLIHNISVSTGEPWRVRVLVMTTTLHLSLLWSFSPWYYFHSELCNPWESPSSFSFPFSVDFSSYNYYIQTLG